MRDLLTVALVAIIFTSSASGRDIHVNNLAGDDRASGNSDQLISPGNGPVRTIQRALRLADFGDRVVLAQTDEPYRESITLEGPRNSGSPLSPFVLEGNGAILDGTARISPDLWRPGGLGLVEYQPPRLSFQQLFMNGKPLPEQPLDRRHQLSALEVGSWCMLNQSIHYRPEVDTPMVDREFAVSLHPVGVTLYNVRHVIVRKLVVQGFQLDGINAHDNAFACQLDTLTCRWNGRSGISVGGASRVKIQNCLLEDNGVTQLRTEGWSRVAVVGGEMIGEPPWQMQGGSLSIDGQVQTRGTAARGIDSAPLHRP